MWGLSDGSPSNGGPTDESPSALGVRATGAKRWGLVDDLIDEGRGEAWGSERWGSDAMGVRPMRDRARWGSRRRGGGEIDGARRRRGRWTR